LIVLLLFSGCWWRLPLLLYLVVFLSVGVVVVVVVVVVVAGVVVAVGGGGGVVVVVVLMVVVAVGIVVVLGIVVVVGVVVAVAVVVVAVVVVVVVMVVVVVVVAVVVVAVAVVVVAVVVVVALGGQLGIVHQSCQFVPLRVGGFERDLKMQNSLPDCLECQSFQEESLLCLHGNSLASLVSQTRPLACAGCVRSHVALTTTPSVLCRCVGTALAGCSGLSCWARAGGGWNHACSQRAGGYHSIAPPSEGTS
jgi:hypothetical protein